MIATPTMSYGLSFIIEHADTYGIEPRDFPFYPYSDADLAQASYVVTLGNGDSHLLVSVAEIQELVDAELWLNGYADEQPASQVVASVPSPHDGSMMAGLRLDRLWKGTTT